MRKFVTGLNFSCEATTSLSLNIESNNDDKKRVDGLAPVRSLTNVNWGADDLYWSEPLLAWNRIGLLSEKRRMPAKSLRCDFKQVKFSNGFVTIVGSDLLGTATVETVTNSVILDDPNLEWPSNAVDYFIYFQTDNYTKPFLIVGRTDDVLTYQEDGGQLFDQSGLRWVIRGHPKDEVFNMINYSIHYRMLGQTQHAFQKSETGENA